MRPGDSSQDRSLLLFLADALPQIKNCAPPLENWTIVGELTSLAADKTALTEFVPMQFTAGSANSFALA
jgi:hypothetical protein